MRRTVRTTSLLVAAALVATTAGIAQAKPEDHYSTKTPTSTGTGGAVTSVDPEASKIGLQVLKRGGNAVDAIIATAAALGVTEPYSSGIGGGGYLVVYDAGTGKVGAIDGRETAPARMPHDAFIDPGTGEPYNFTPELVTSGVSVGTPGSLATWQRALDRWGTRDLAQTLQPSVALARRGFVVDDTFRSQTLDNKDRFGAFDATRKLFLPGGDAPAVGSVFRNPDLANTYKLIAREGTRAFYRGPLADQIAQTAQHPPKRGDTTLPVPAGYLTANDLARYAVKDEEPTRVGYRGYGVYGAPPSSSGGTTVGEALNILEHFPMSKLSRDDALHHYLEAGSLAFADRNAYVGDPAYVDIPQQRLLSDDFAKTRACLVKGNRALPKPVAAGSLTSSSCGAGADVAAKPDTENVSTTNLTATDRWGNVAEYTLTIEQTGGSGMVVPGRGFLLNNELTDFTAAYDPADPNRIEGGKRPRSSISPTIVLKDRKPVLALGSPGGSTIITTVLQMLVDRIDFAMTLPEMIAAPRSSPRNTADVSSEPAFIDEYGDALAAYGHHLVPAGDAFTSAAEIGAATAIGIGPDGRLTAVSEPVRRGGGSALVVNPDR
ncbi:gamma-glutamyltranspeptidase [Marmoricola endophyticus]|uniref:Glutathione hydrolase proenzyme n=1 Tax=Marmoricola endophyticus TaxID=2040280 RepID=A0A917BT94_9ACTN|nr:gamma-glutamyltransferase [Marmoricola endophyticus]GGF55483.1 gamma-glutamyltranspeptidase [Marmoricola endophyticus]